MCWDPRVEGRRDGLDRRTIGGFLRIQHALDEALDGADVNLGFGFRRCGIEPLEADQGEGVLVLTDMFGGTPSNISLSFLGERRVEVVTGMNLPMLIKLATLTEEPPLPELAGFMKEYGRRNISVASELLPEDER